MEFNKIKTNKEKVCEKIDLIFSDKSREDEIMILFNEYYIKSKNNIIYKNIDNYKNMLKEFLINLYDFDKNILSDILVSDIIKYIEDREILILFENRTNLQNKINRPYRFKFVKIPSKNVIIINIGLDITFIQIGFFIREISGSLNSFDICLNNRTSMEENVISDFQSKYFNIISLCRFSIAIYTNYGYSNFIGEKIKQLNDFLLTADNSNLDEMTMLIKENVYDIINYYYVFNKSVKMYNQMSQYSNILYLSLKEIIIKLKL